jgi:hypothetical protein
MSTTAAGIAAIVSVLQVVTFIEMDPDMPAVRPAKLWACFIIFLLAVCVPVTYLRVMRDLLRSLESQLQSVTRKSVDCGSEELNAGHQD